MTFKPLSDELFRLVKSLSVSEVGYFTSHLKKQKSRQINGYLDLVVRLRTESDYDEEAIRKSCRGKELKNNFAYHKDVLHGYVLDSLIACHAHTSITYAVFRYMEAADLLSRRSLFAQALKLLGKANDVAAGYQKFSVLLQVVEAQHRVLKQTKLPDLKQKLKANSKEKKEVLRKIESEDDYAALNDEAFILYREYEKMKTDEKLKELEALMLNPLLKDPATALTFDSKLRFHYIRSNYHQLKGNFIEAMKHREAVLKVWDKFSLFNKELPERYRTDLSNLLSLRLLTGSYKDFEPLLQRLEDMKNDTTEQDAASFRDVFHLRQLYYHNTGRKEEALQLMPAIEKGLKKYDAYINPSRLLSFYFNIVSVYFVCRHYKEALEWTTKIIDTGKNREVRTDLVDFTYVLEIILHYETGRHTLAEYEVRNTRARLKKNNKLYEFEQLVLLFINRVIHCELTLIASALKQQKLAAIWQRFLQALEELSKQPGMDTQLGLEEITIWVKSKVHPEAPPQ